MASDADRGMAGHRTDDGGGNYWPFVRGLAAGADLNVPDQSFRVVRAASIANNLTGRPMPVVRFKTPLLYKIVRHPIYLGFIIAFWVAPS